MVFELYKQHLVEDDKELLELYNKCKSGEMLCAECKEICCKKMTSFLSDFEHKLKENKKKVGSLHFIQFK
jgi:tryptophanyl-tRNA synthetase